MKKRIAAVGLAAALVGAQPAGAKIVEGQSIAGVKLGASMAQVIGQGGERGWWIAQYCRFEGTARQAGSVGVVRGSRIEQRGLAAMAVTEERLIGILSPLAGPAPAVWWSWPLESLAAGTTGSKGMFRKRPAFIELTGADGLLVLGEVARLFRRSGRYQAGPEGALMEALGG